MNGQAAIPRGNVAAPAEEGFEDWVRASSRRLRRLAYLLTGDLDQAEDLLQSAYAKLLPRWHKISTYDSPETYMYRVMVNLRTSWWRRSRDREWSTDEIPEASWRVGTPGEGDAVVESQCCWPRCGPFPSGSALLWSFGTGATCRRRRPRTS